MPANNPGSKSTQRKDDRRSDEDTLRFDQDDVRKAVAQRDAPPSKNEGEGNRSADRAYRRGVEHFLADADVEQRARDAEEALDGEEAEELAEAEQHGKKPAHSN